jgi:hypothetical protein
MAPDGTSRQAIQGSLDRSGPTPGSHQKLPQSDDEVLLDEQSLELLSDVVTMVIVVSLSADPDFPEPRRTVVFFSIFFRFFFVFSMPQVFPSRNLTEQHLRKFRGSTAK